MKFGIPTPGSKNRLLKKGLGDYIRPNESGKFVDVFGGGGAVTDKFSRPDSPFDLVQYNEINPDKMEAVKTALTGKIPKLIPPSTRQDWESMSPIERYVFSYNGNGVDPVLNMDDVRLSQIKDRLAEVNSFKNRRKPIDFTSKSYDELAIDPEATVYLDPPYRNTRGYGNSFDNEGFESWARDLPNRDVYLSEYAKIPGFRKVVDYPVITNVGGNPIERVERLSKKTGRLGDLSKLNRGAGRLGALAVAAGAAGLDALMGEEGNYQNMATAFVPGLDMATKLAEGKSPGLLDIPGPGAFKLATIPLIKKVSREHLKDGASRIGTSLRNQK